MSFSIEKTKTIANSIEGFLTDEEGTLLYNLAKKCTGKGVIIEIGSYKGKSTVWIASGSKVGKQLKIFAIDPHSGTGYGDTYTDFIKNIVRSRVDNIIHPIVSTSEIVAKNFSKPVEFIFIDGCHDYNMTLLDFETWYPKVIDGGFMAFHDTLGKTGPNKVVKDVIYKSTKFRNVGIKGSITYAQKVSSITAIERIRNLTVLLIKNVYELTILTYKITITRKLNTRKT